MVFLHSILNRCRERNIYIDNTKAIAFAPERLADLLFSRRPAAYFALRYPRIRNRLHDLWLVPDIDPYWNGCAIARFWRVTALCAIRRHHLTRALMAGLFSYILRIHIIRRLGG